MIFICLMFALAIIYGFDEGKMGNFEYFWTRELNIYFYSAHVYASLSFDVNFFFSISQGQSNIIQYMSGQEYNRKIEECRKQINSLKKDILYRDEQVARNEATYALDAEIRGQFIQVDEEIQTLRLMIDNFQKKSKDLGLTSKDLEKRKKAFDVNIGERNKAIEMYDASLARKIPNSAAAKATDNMNNFNKAYEKPMNKADLVNLKQAQEKAQEDALDDLLGVVKHMKNGNTEIGKQLKQQDVLLDNLDNGLDQNSENMSKVRRNLNKLLQSSSYTCLVLVIILQIAGIACNLLLWPKK